MKQGASQSRWPWVVTTIVAIGLVVFFLVPQSHWWLNNTYWGRHQLDTRLRELTQRFKSGQGTDRALDELIDLADSRYSFVRSCACGYIGTLGPDADRSIPTLLAALDCGDGFIEQEAAEALGKVTRGSDVAVAALIRKVNPEGGSVSWRAAEALGEIGSSAVTAVPLLTKLANDPRQSTPNSSYDILPDIARKSLQKINGQVVPPLRKGSEGELNLEIVQ